MAFTNCSKSGPVEPEKPIQEIKTGTDILDKYASTNPELEKYQHFAEGATFNKQFKIVAAIRGVEALICT